MSDSNNGSATADDPSGGGPAQSLALRERHVQSPALEGRQVQSLGVERPGQAYVWGYDEGPLGDGHFRLDTLYTGLSAGTELTFFKGTNPYLHSRYDAAWGVFRGGEPSAHFPVPFLGYMEVGPRRREPHGRRAGGRRGGDGRTATKTGHTAHPAHETFAVLPPEMDPVLGIYVAQMGPICANGLLHAAADLHGGSAAELGDGVRGRRVLVTGAGTIGLLLGLWAEALGASEVAVADPTPERRAAAEALGLRALDGFEHAAWWCKEHWHYGDGDRGAEVVFQCRGQDEALEAALKALRPQGTVIDLAFYQGGAPNVRLGEAFHHNGLRLHCAQIGRVPRALRHAWTRRRLMDETVRLLQTHGSAVREHLITDIVPFSEAPELMRQLAGRERHVIQAVFAVHA